MLNRAAFTDIAALGRQLGVRYLLEGNVRRVGANLRVTTQLLEAATGEIVWTAKFDRPLAELAELQEELVTDIAASLDTQVYALEMERALKKPGDITAWEAVARACPPIASTTLQPGRSGDRGSQARRRHRAGLCAGACHARRLLSPTLTLLSPDDPAEVQRIRAIAERALALAPDDASVLGCGWASALLYRLSRGR